MKLNQNSKASAETKKATREETLMKILPANPLVHYGSQTLIAFGAFQCVFAEWCICTQDRHKINYSKGSIGFESIFGHLLKSNNWPTNNALPASPLFLVVLKSISCFFWKDVQAISNPAGLAAASKSSPCSSLKICCGLQGLIRTSSMFVCC